MHSSSEMYKEVAERCSAYDKCCGSNCNTSSQTSMTNSVDNSKSCMNCRHFADDGHCRLDLYDSIAKEL